MIPVLRLAALITGLAGEPAWAQAEVDHGSGAVLRGLDKVDGHVTDIELKNGDVIDFGRLLVQLGECRYPAGDPAADAFAYLIIRDAETGAALFAGWMLASSPALNALEHPRYDIWVLRCKSA